MAADDPSAAGGPGFPISLYEAVLAWVRDNLTAASAMLVALLVVVVLLIRSCGGATSTSGAGCGGLNRLRSAVGTSASDTGFKLSSDGAWAIFEPLGDPDQRNVYHCVNGTWRIAYGQNGGGNLGEECNVDPVVKNELDARCP